MTLPQLLCSYLSANILICFGFLLLATITGVLKLAGRPLLFKGELKLHHSLLTIVAIIGLLSPFIPKREIFTPIARVWTAPSGSALNDVQFQKSIGGYVDIRSASAPIIKLWSVGISIGLMLAAVLLLGLIKFCLDLRKLLVFREQGLLVRSFCSVHIFVSERVRVPFSFWIPKQKNVVIPESLIGTENFKSAVLHELQHHRQGDTKWVYLLWGLRLIFFPNPFVHMWNKRISEAQEFACDEALIDQGKVESLAYASCLVQVAQAAVERRAQPVCATGLIFMIERNMLKRRITAMLEQKKSRCGFRSVLPILGIAAVLLGLTAYASQGIIRDRRITMSQAQEIAKSTNHGSFRVVVNEMVLKWLNYYLGTPDGRDKVRAALARMENYRGTIQGKLAEYLMPEEFLAIPLIESGYQNLEPKPNKATGPAGLWQFIASTAQNFGLQVDEQVDERLNVKQETDAAMRYLLSNKLRFKDWQLSILAYNAGEKSVQNAILKAGSRDPWTIIKSGFSGPAAVENSNYLPKLMAAILIVKNPSLTLE
jgi:beta-lactamase regulating signal transducer with metallopeptidase domain